MPYKFEILCNFRCQLPNDCTKSIDTQTPANAKLVNSDCAASCDFKQIYGVY